MNNRLLPVGSSPLELAAAIACAEIERTPIPLRQLWNPKTCPLNLLPYLAWAFSVDHWDATWPEETKRDVIAAAYYIHSRKGTISAVRRVVEPLGYVVNVNEWWETNDPPGTFRPILAYWKAVSPRKCITRWSDSSQTPSPPVATLSG